MTRYRILLVAWLFLALAALAPTARAGVEAVEPPVPVAIPATDEEIAKVLAAAEKAKADKDDVLMANVLFTMRERRSDSFVPWIEAGLKSKDVAVLQQSIHAATAHELEAHAKTIRKLFTTYAKKKDKPKKKKSDDEESPASSRGVMIACIEFLATFAIEGDEKAVHEQLDDLFKHGATPGDWAADFLRVALMYLGRTKWMPSVPTLVELVDEPVPENPDAGDNPPATYWEARYNLWLASEGWVRWALKEITGQEYRTHREWKAWVNANEKKFK